MQNSEKTPYRIPLTRTELSFALQAVLKPFSERTQDIVRRRYGTESGTQNTLEEIGTAFSITRERVRQIVNDVIGRITATQPAALQLVSGALSLSLFRSHGIIKKEKLITEAGGSDPGSQAATRFFVECLPSVVECRNLSGEASDICTMPSFDINHWLDVKNQVRSILERRRTPLPLADIRAALADAGMPIEETALQAFLAASDQVASNRFAKWGLSSWSEMKPKSTREKAYLVLKESGSPQHFREITRLIDHYGLNKKKTHPQTVHNELIKDPRFVLVGRGVYALAEWGYRQGTVRDVLVDILRARRLPMKRDDILQEILKRRQVKKSTIMINLNNSAYFVKNRKGEYALKAEH